MKKYTAEFNENEFLLLIVALGAMASQPGAPTIQADQTVPPASALELSRRLLNLYSGFQSPPPAMPAQPIPASPAPAQGETDKTAAIIRPFEVKKVGSGNKEHIWVKWKVGNVTNSANCWKDKQALWPRLQDSVNKQISVIVEEKSGYLNIVGLK